MPIKLFFPQKEWVMKKAVIFFILTALFAALPFNAAFAAGGDASFSVTLYTDGRIEWCRVDSAGAYWIGINGGFLPAGDVTEYSLPEQGGISEPGAYKIEISAYDADSTELIRNTVITVEYDGEKFFVIGTPSGPASPSTDALGLANADTEPASDDSSNKVRTILIVVSAVLGVAAIVAVIVIEIAVAKKKDAGR